MVEALIDAAAEAAQQPGVAGSAPTKQTDPVAAK